MKKREMEQPYLDEEKRRAVLSVLLRNSGIFVFEYSPKEDTLIVYNEKFQVVKKRVNLMLWIEETERIYPKDKWKFAEFFRGSMRGKIEVRIKEDDGHMARKILDASYLKREGDCPDILIGTSKDITAEKQKEEYLKEKARRDSLTNLYNKQYGKWLINEYLSKKNSHDSCGLMVVDVDDFKHVNDTYGHLFGDAVLTELSKLLQMFCDPKDIVMRAGGDEFVVFLKDISHTVLMKKSMYLMQAIRRLSFEEDNYSMTCSVGVCYLSQNISGCNYEQLFKNADGALYRAKEEGRNRYVFYDV